MFCRFLRTQGHCFRASLNLPSSSSADREAWFSRLVFVSGWLARSLARFPQQREPLPSCPRLCRDSRSGTQRWPAHAVACSWARRHTLSRQTRLPEPQPHGDIGQVNPPFERRFALVVHAVMQRSAFQFVRDFGPLRSLCRRRKFC